MPQRNLLNQMPKKDIEKKNRIDKLNRNRILNVMDIVADSYKRYGYTRQAKIIKNLKQDTKTKLSQL